MEQHHGTRFVGIDYHEGFVQLCVMDPSGQRLRERRAANDAAAIVEAVGSASSVQAAVESSTGAADLAEALGELGWCVALAHAGYVQKLRQSPDKTDLSDAALLADLLRVGYLPRSYHPTAWERDLRRLVRHRQAEADRRRALKQRVSSLVRDHRLGKGPASRWTKAWVEWVRGHEAFSEVSRWLIERLLDEIDHVSRSIEQLKERLRRYVAGDALSQRLLREKGIGLVTATHLRAEVGRFDRFRSGKALARFCGFSPANRSSGGKRSEAGLIGAADRRLRATLLQAAWVIMRCVPRYRALARKWQAQGKPKPKIAAGVMNRYLRRLYHRMQPAA